jgi:hypothetical protein
MNAIHGTSHNINIKQLTTTAINMFSREVWGVDFFFMGGVVDTVFIEHKPLLMILFL